MSKQWNGYYVYNDEIVALIALYNTAEVKDKKILMWQMVEKLSYMVFARIKKFRGQTIYEDLLQEGRIGLIKAINDFDINRGPNFFKFASWHIQNRLRKFYTWNYKMPITIRKIRESQKDEEMELDDDDPHFSVEKEEISRTIQDAVNDLTNIDKKVLVMRYGIFGGEEHTFEQIGNEFSLSKQRIEQIKCRAVSRLKRNTKIKKALY